MRGYLDGSRLLVIVRDHVLLAACVSLECLLSFESVSLLVRPGHISPALSLARESRYQGDVLQSLTTPLRVYCDCSIVHFLRAFL